MAITDKLQELLDVKQDIKVAIEGKGVDMTGVPFTGYPTKIDSITAGGGGQGYTLTINNRFNSPSVILIYANGTISEQFTYGTFYNVVAICHNLGISIINGSVLEFSNGVYAPPLSPTFNYMALLLFDTTLYVTGTGGGVVDP